MLIIVISFVCSTVQYHISTDLNSGDMGGGWAGTQEKGGQEVHGRQEKRGQETIYPRRWELGEIKKNCTIFTEKMFTVSCGSYDSMTWKQIIFILTVRMTGKMFNYFPQVIIVDKDMQLSIAKKSSPNIHL